MLSFAQVLNCTIDFLLGLSNDTTPPEAKQKATIIDGGLYDEEVEYIRRYRAMSPEMRAVALAMLEAVEKVRQNQDSSSTDK